MTKLLFVDNGIEFDSILLKMDGEHILVNPHLQAFLKKISRLGESKEFIQRFFLKENKEKHLRIQLTIIIVNQFQIL